MATASNHDLVLKKLCRVCGYLLEKNRAWNNFTITKDLAEKIKTYMLLETSADTDIHPKQICMKCYSAIKNAEKRGSSNSTQLFEFNAHSENHCLVCERAEQLSNIHCAPIRKKKRSPGRTNITTKIWDKRNLVI